MRVAVAIAASMIALTACATTPAASGGRSCRNDRLASVSGLPRTPALEASILRASGAHVIRWVAKGMMATMEYRADRVTVQLDGQDRVETARCG